MNSTGWQNIAGSDSHTNHTHPRQMSGWDTNQTENNLAGLGRIVRIRVRDYTTHTLYKQKISSKYEKWRHSSARSTQNLQGKYKYSHFRKI